MSTETVKKKPNPVLNVQPVLRVIDIQKGCFLPYKPASAMPFRPDSTARYARACAEVDAARAADKPIVFSQETHHRSSATIINAWVNRSGEQP